MEQLRVSPALELPQQGRAVTTSHQGGPELLCLSEHPKNPKKSQSTNSCMDEAPWVTSMGLWADFR